MHLWRKVPPALWRHILRLKLKNHAPDTKASVNQHLLPAGHPARRDFPFYR
jgi:hypothetical protein